MRSIMKSVVTVIAATLLFTLTAIRVLGQTSSSTSSSSTGSSGTLTIGTATAQYQLSKPKPELPHNYQGEYVVITRHWSAGGCVTPASSLSSSGSAVVLGSSGQFWGGSDCGGSWQYDFDVFPGMDAAIEAVKKDCSYSGSMTGVDADSVSHYPCIHPAGTNETGDHEFVGVYQFSLKLGPDEVHLEEGDREQVHVVRDKMHWFKWTIKSKGDGNAK